MKIKNRILLYNSLMGVVSIIAVLIIGGFVIALWGYARPDNIEEGASAAHVQVLLNTFLPESASIDHLGDEVELDGFTLYVLESTSFTESQASTIISIEDFARIQTAASFVVEDRLVIAREVTPYLLVAVQNQVPRAPFNLQHTFIAFIIVAVVFIATIAMISYFFTRSTLKHISRPLAALASSASRVELGDLSRPIEYKGSDEFKTVCDSFDRMQQHLKEEKEKNAAYEKARTDLLSGISHDLRTPLTAVKGYIKGLQDGVANTPEKQESYLKTAFDKANEMDGMLQSLFFFSKMETGNMPVYKQRYDLVDLVRYHADECSIDLALNDVLVNDESDGQPHFADVDREQLQRVLTNLTENAAKYGGVVPLVITIRVSSEPMYEVITFSDNGNGVDESKLPFIFDEFWRGDTARHNIGNSSGLGLYIVKRIVEAHGGHIVAQNDGGLKITMRFPKPEEDNA